MEKLLNSIVMYNTTIVQQPIRLEGLARRLTDKSIEFIERSATSKTKKPFALFHSFTNVHTPLITGKEFKDQSIGDHGAYGDSIIEMDVQVRFKLLIFLLMFIPIIKVHSSLHITINDYSFQGWKDFGSH